MKLQLSYVESNNSGSTWEDVTEHGTLSSNVTKGDKLFFSTKNLAGEHRVTVFISEPNSDKPKMLPCSDLLSKIVRKALKGGVTRKQVMRVLFDLKVIENDKGMYLVPNGTPNESFTPEEIKKESVLSYEEFTEF